MDYCSRKGPKMSEPAVKVVELTKKYGKHNALTGISLTVKKSEIFGLAGPNGAGKSTLLAVLATVVRPTGGYAYIDGKNVTTAGSRVRTQIGYVPQEISLYTKLPGIANLRFWAELFGIKGNTRRRRIAEAVELAGLGDRIADRVDTYSGGMKKRLNIAVSLLHRPRVLLMDEPTAGVDIISRKYIMEMMKEWSRAGRTVIFTSHYMEDMESVCDRVALLDRGELECVGTIDELRHKYGTQSISDILMCME